MSRMCWIYRIVGHMFGVVTKNIINSYKKQIEVHEKNNGKYGIGIDFYEHSSS